MCASRGATLRNARHTYYLAIAVALATVLLYLPAVHNGFVNWDDDVYVTDRLQIRSLDGAFFKWAFTSEALGFWHPLTWVSLAIDRALWGLDPSGYHSTAILLHGCNTFLVVLLIAYLLQVAERISFTRGRTSIPVEQAGSVGRRGLIVGTVTGVLFGIHPIHVESAAWISERKDLLCAFFYLLSVLSYVKYAARGSDPIAGASAARGTDGTSVLPFYRSGTYYLSVMLFLCALASKTMAVTLPAVLVIIDWYPLRRVSTAAGRRGSLIEKIPFVIMSLAISIVSILSQQTYGALSLLEAPFTTRVLVAIRSISAYLLKMVRPVDLLPLYPYPDAVSPVSLEYGYAIVALCGITAACIAWRRTFPALLAGWSYYLVTLAPVLGIVQVGFVPMADRFMYLPSIGPFLLLGLGCDRVWARIRTGGRWRLEATSAAVAGMVAIVALLSLLSVRQMAVWKDSLTFWNYVIEKAPNVHPVAYLNRGLAFKERGQLQHALADINKALDRETHGTANIYNSRGTVFTAMGLQGRAIEDFTRALELEPDFADAYTNRGIAQDRLGRGEQALADLGRAIELDAGQKTAYYYRAMLQKRSGRPDLAVRDLTDAIAADPSFAAAYLERGVLFEQLSRTDLAFDDYSAAISEGPGFANAYNNRGLLLQKTGNLDAALKDLDRAIMLDPKSVEAYTNRGLVFEDMGRFDEALEDHTKAIEIDAADPLSYNNRAIAFERAGRIDLARKDFRRACDLGYQPSCDVLRKTRSR